MMIFVACFTGFYVLVSNAVQHNHNHNKHLPHHSFSRPMDEHMHYSQILPFGDEWKRALGKTEYGDSPAPVNFWLKCIDKELRGYFHIEDTRKRPSHGKEGDMPIAYKFHEHVKMYADDKRIDYGIWMGGGEFKVDLSHKANNATVNIYIEDWMHYIPFSLQDCTKFRPESKLPETKYVMNMYTRYFDNPHKLDTRAIDAIAKHYLYHRCALGLSNYEINLQKEQIPYFMKNPVIAEGARSGLITFILKNPYIPTPIRNAGRGGSDCYWQQISQNLALLRRWKQNVRLYLWDGDEYMTYSPLFTKQEFNALVQEHPVLAFDRYMAFCEDCPKDPEGELKYLSFTDRKYKKSDKLQHPKLLVDPTQAGCFMIHWSGCGSTTSKPAWTHHPRAYHVNDTLAFVSHFENMYFVRFEKDISKNIDLNVEYPMMKYCDPGKQLNETVPYYF